MRLKEYIDLPDLIKSFTNGKIAYLVVKTGNSETKIYIVTFNHMFALSRVRN